MESTNSNAQIRKAVQGLFLLNALIWIILGIVSFWRTYSDTNPQGIVYTIVSIMLIGNAAALLLSAWLVVKRDVWGYLFALAILAANIFFTFTCLLYTSDAADE